MTRGGKTHRSSLANASARACVDEPATEGGGRVEDMLGAVCDRHRKSLIELNYIPRSAIHLLVQQHREITVRVMRCVWRELRNPWFAGNWESRRQVRRGIEFTGRSDGRNGDRQVNGLRGDHLLVVVGWRSDTNGSAEQASIDV